jgi:hypothetical protein
MAVTTAPNRKNTPRAMTIRPMNVARSLTVAGNPLASSDAIRYPPAHCGS